MCGLAVYDGESTLLLKTFSHFLQTNIGDKYVKLN